MKIPPISCETCGQPAFHDLLAAGDYCARLGTTARALTPAGSPDPRTCQGLLASVYDIKRLRYEAALIRRALVSSGGRVTAAARVLGMTHQRLHHLLEGRHRALKPDRQPKIARPNAKGRTRKK